MSSITPLVSTFYMIVGYETEIKREERRTSGMLTIKETGNESVDTVTHTHTHTCIFRPLLFYMDPLTCPPTQNILLSLGDLHRGHEM